MGSKNSTLEFAEAVFLDIGIGQHEQHARRAQRGCDVNPMNARMRVRGTEHVTVHHIVHRDVIYELAAPSQESPIFRSQDRLPKSYLASGLNFSVHDAAQAVVELRCKGLNPALRPKPVGGCRR
jgi:hypothetical protein